MEKNIQDRLDRLENELKESKKEIHNLKSSVSFIVESGIKKTLSRFSRKQIIIGSAIILVFISIIGIASTVTKPYTFSTGEVVSASKFNANFDTLFTLVNGNLDDANISGISGSKINSGTIAAARIDNLEASKITSGVFDKSTIPKPEDHITFFTTPNIFDGNLGGRSGADAKCLSHMDNETITMFNNSCSNVRAVISVSSSDEIRDMESNYNVPTNKKIRGRNGIFLADGWDNVTGGENAVASGSGNMLDHPLMAGVPELSGGTGNLYWTGSNYNGSLRSNNHCSAWSTNSGAEYGGSGYGVYNRDILSKDMPFERTCDTKKRILCICY